MEKKKQILLAIVGVFVVIVGVIGFTYAFWNKTFQQTDQNIVNTDCFDIAFAEGDAIQLNKAYPMLDAEGKALTPYTFTLTNKCASYSKYQINLENINTTTLKEEYLKLQINPTSEKGNLGLLTSFSSVDPTYDNATSARNIYEGYLDQNAEMSFELRLWMDENVTAEQTDSMNKSYAGKISIITSYATEIQKPTLIETVKAITPVTTGTGIYEVTHEDADITYTDDVTAINNLKMTELRYSGKDPDNYVTFNNELWRIIGLVNTPEGQRVKLIRNESIGSFSWDSSDSVNSGNGVNEWSQADLMELLNHGAYYNRTTGTCYNGVNNATTSCDFSSTGLTSEAKSMIDTITWNTGTNGSNDFTSSSNGLVRHFYNYERSNNTGKVCSSGSYCNDTVTRTTTWTGEVGLMYPSDYGYATSGGSTTDRSSCLAKELYNWKDSSVSDCKNNDWLYTKTNQMTLIPRDYSTNASHVFVVFTGYVSNGYASNVQSSRPSIYLKSSIKVTSGKGTASSPYTLGM